jgi:soluble lytic murein transglycosylase-like protein
MSKNIYMRLCFLAAAPVLAAGSLISAPPEASEARVKTVVRADPRTGKLVRIVVSSAQSAAGKPAGQTARSAAAPPAAAAFGGIVERIANEQAIPSELIHSVIQVESNYNPGAVSPKGAQGLMQLMPDTARRFGVPNSFDPVENIQGGAKYLKYLLELYKGDYPQALAAYNAGEKAVAKYGGIPPYAETRNYVEQVQRRIQAARPAAGKNAAPKAAAPAPPSVSVSGEPAPRHLQTVVAADGSVRYVTQ